MIVTGAGICTSLTASTNTIKVIALNAAAASSRPADISKFTAAQGLITSCWDPSTKASIAVTGLTATNVALACVVRNISFNQLIFFAF